MGYYESPPMIQQSRGSEIISAAITNAASALSQGIIAKGERKRQAEKEQKLTLQKLQDRKNETDLYYNDKLSDWSSKETGVNNVVDKKIYDIIQKKITLAADSRIALLNETNSEKRQEYLKNIRNADNALSNAAGFSKRFAPEVATYKLDTKASTLGVAGGNIVNGKDDKSVLDNSSVLEVVGGMDSLYLESNIDVEEDEDGDGFILKVSGKRKDGTIFNVPIRTKEYLKSDAEFGDTMLSKVESTDVFNKQAMEVVAAKDGKVYEGLLNKTHTTIDLDSSGPEVYQIRDARELQEVAIRSKINEKARITAAGIVGTDSQTRIKNYIDLTLNKGMGWYDENWKGKLNPEQQVDTLAKLLEDKTFNGLVKDFPRTSYKDKEGNTITKYYNPDQPTNIKPKEETTKTGGGKGGKSPFTPNQIKDYKDKFSALVAGKVTELVVPSKGGQKKYIYNKEEGVVQEVSPDGLEIRNNKVTGEYFRETILGIPAKPKP